ncbi:TetR/AcrR family transcriptional regulator [Rhodococcus wratislaviensis]|uniref:TetR/AcrR family transcriptional regulator n=1 Tax=Rhodococcus wratislaviensis TaxID=44752 RepID=UPI0036492EEB
MAGSSRLRILDGALSLLRSGGSVSLESAAVEAGVTKPGLMYHFPTKEALMVGLVNHVVDRWERKLVDLLGVPVAQARPEARIRAYADFALVTDFDATDIVMLSDPRLRESLSARWESRMAAWIDVPDDLPAAQRARLLAVRLLADGAWFASAASVFALSHADREQVRALALNLLEE